MANALKTFVEDFILNPAASFNIVDEDGFQDGSAIINSKVLGREGIEGAFTNKSTLRIKNNKLLSEKDPRYEGKKVSRKSLTSNNEDSFDPDLAKYFLIEEDSENDLSTSNDEEDNSFYESESEKKISKKKSKKEKHVSIEDSVLALGEDEEEEDSFNDNSEDENDVSNNESDNDDVSEKTEDDDSGLEEMQLTEKGNEPTPVVTFCKEDTEDIEKGVAVKNQYSIFDALFETRVGMQKMVSMSNQLPQHNSYQHFLNENDLQFKTNLQQSRRAVKKLVSHLLDLQKILLQRNSEFKKLDGICNSDEEISSDKEESQPDSSRLKRGKKRQVEEYGEIIRKRHRAMIPFRNDVLNKWHGKTNLLVNRSSSSKFSNFEISPVQQIQNILSNKNELIQRTQLRSGSRGNLYYILGKGEVKKDDSIGEVYDTEIFDDTDFYSRMLEDILKSKMSLSDDMSDISTKWMEIQSLRKKAKKKVDTKASKGRKIRYEVLSKLQQFMAPCKPSLMDDAAINIIFSSCFGKSQAAIESIS